ncbi:MAG TPA: porin [Vicinamibacterales bacterium]
MNRPLIVALLIAFAAAPAAAQDEKGIVWNDRPRIVFGDDLTVDIKGRVLTEWRTFDPEIGEDMFNLRTARIGLQGELTRHFDWEIEREIEEVEQEDGSGKVQFGQWKDVYLEWRTFDRVRVIGGRFKMPFGLEQTTGVSDLDFAYRALGSTAIAPGRDRGVMAFGEIGRLTYEAGMFDDDGDNGESNEPQFAREGEDLEGVGPSIAFRVTGDLLRLVPGVGRLQSANIGVAYTNSQIPEGLNSLRGESFWGTEDFFERVYVKGRRQRFGAQFEWTPGPASLKAEWLQSREQRKEQSNRDADLSDFVGTAWYVAGTWFLTGEDKDNNVNPRRPLHKGGPGAIELAVRYERLGFESVSKEGTSFTNPRSEFLTPNSNTVFTAGVNWMTSRWTRVILNAIHEDIEDPARTPIVGTTSYWSGLVRLNIVF